MLPGTARIMSADEVNVDELMKGIINTDFSFKTVVKCRLLYLDFLMDCSRTLDISLMDWT